VRICIFGAGAVGSYIGGMLARSGAEVTLVARGAHLAAVRASGLTVVERPEGSSFTVRPAATDDPSSLPPQDVVIVTTKAHQAPLAADAIAGLLAPGGIVVTAMNGIPWWYFYAFDGPLGGRRLAACDPGDRQWTAIGPERVVGGVLYLPAEVFEPGHVAHTGPKRLVLGEPDGRISARAGAIGAALEAAGIGAPVIATIRDEVWNKLVTNVAINPTTALTLAAVDVQATDPGMRPVLSALMLEAGRVATALGANVTVDTEARLTASAGNVGHKTSMLQDMERRRSLEIDPILGVVAELGDIAGVETPTIDMVLALIRLRGRIAGIYGS